MEWYQTLRLGRSPTRPTMVFGMLYLIQISYDEDLIYTETMKPVNLQNFFMKIHLHTVWWANPENMPEDMVVFIDFPAESFQDVFWKAVQLCLREYLVQLPDFFNQAKYVKPGDEIYIGPGRAYDHERLSRNARAP